MPRPVKGYINKILPHSFVDGPGNRSVIFLQGCPFHCRYCHNPYTINFCNHCGSCLEVCPAGAIILENQRIEWLAEQCTDCDACIEVCPNFSSPKVHVLTPEDTWNRIKPNLPFISGVTFTGGEPVFQDKFLYESLKLIKQESELTTCIETNGFFSAGIFDHIIPLVDFVMVDFKAFHPEIHNHLTGKHNLNTKHNIKLLWETSKLFMVRTTIVPGFTDTHDEIRSISRFLVDIDPNIHLRLLRFRPHGVKDEARNWKSPGDKLMDQLCETARSTGLTHVDRSL